MVLALLWPVPAGATTTTLAWPDLCNSAGLTVEDDAVFAGCECRLTVDTTNRQGCMWTDPGVAFDATTSFRSVAQLAIRGGDGGTGLAFSVQSVGATACDGDIRYMGLLGVVPSVSVEMDTFLSSGGEDADENHVALVRDGDVDDHVVVATPSFDLDTVGAFWLWVDWAAATDRLQIYLSTGASKPATPLLDVTEDVLGWLGNPATAWMGFSASTGGSGTNEHAVLSWTLEVLDDADGDLLDDQDEDPCPGDPAPDADGDGVCAPDCDDSDAGRFPGNPEIGCNEVDDDCDGATLDEAAAEVPCNLVDDDCDPITPDGPDGDGDGASACAGDCDDADPTVSPLVGEMACNLSDDDCDPATPDDSDADADGAMLCGGDCDDLDATVHPGAADPPGDGVDADCDGSDGTVAADTGATGTPGVGRTSPTPATLDDAGCRCSGSPRSGVAWPLALALLARVRRSRWAPPRAQAACRRS